MGTVLKDMAEDVYETEVLLGWQPNSNTFGDSIALLHSEVSEAFEAYREGGTADHTMPHAYDGYGDIEPSRPAKPEGVGSEFADVLIRLLASSRQWGIDLDFEYERKMAFNATRGHRHGGKLL